MNAKPKINISNNNLGEPDKKEAKKMMIYNQSIKEAMEGEQHLSPKKSKKKNNLRSRTSNRKEEQKVQDVEKAKTPKAKYTNAKNNPKDQSVSDVNRTQNKKLARKI